MTILLSVFTPFQCYVSFITCMVFKSQDGIVLGDSNIDCIYKQLIIYANKGKAIILLFIERKLLENLSCLKWMQPGAKTK